MESSSPLSGDTPPRQGTHVLAARSDIVEVILPPARETLSPLPSRPSELFGIRKERAPGESELIRLRLEERRVPSRDGKMSSSSECSAKKTARRVYSCMLRGSRANGNHDSRGSPRHTRSAGGGGGWLPGPPNVVGPRAGSPHPGGRGRARGAGVQPPASEREPTGCA